MKTSAKILGATLFVLALLCAIAWSAAAQADHRGRLTVSFFPAGQGSAALVVAPSGRQALIDGGPDASIVRTLSAQLPWWDHSLAVVVSSSPDAKYSTGLVDVLRRYHVQTIVRSALRGTDSASRALDSAIAAAQKSGAQVSTAKRGQVLQLGDGAYMEILAPDRDLSGVRDADGCTVVRVVYGSTAFMLPCAASVGLRDYLAYLDGASLKSNVLAVPGTPDLLFAGYVSPQYAVLAHDCKKPLSESASTTLARVGAQAMDTCGGTLSFVSDGHSVSLR